MARLAPTCSTASPAPSGAPNIDRYNLIAPYFIVDPNSLGKGTPGVLAFYSMSHDSNPGIISFSNFAPWTTVAGPQGPNAEDEAVELQESLLSGSLMLTARQETINNGLGAFSATTPQDSQPSRFRGRCPISSCASKS